MAKGDIQPFETSGNKFPGALKFAVASGTTASISAGEPVQKAAGVAYVALAATNFPTTTLRHVGVAASASTETASAVGTVDVIPSTPGTLWLISPNAPTSWDTQAEYNALVGARVLIDLTTGTFTILASDSAGNGCVVEYLDISKTPAKVCFSFSPLSYYANV